MVMHLRSCCCGCSLKTGTVIIGVLSAIGALVGLVLAILGASVGTGQLQNEMVKELHKQNTLTPQQYDKVLADLNDAPKGNTTFTVVFVCLAIVNAFHLILSILMVFGASAERPRLVKPWIVFAVVSLVIQSILTLVNIIATMIAGQVLAGILTLVIVAVCVTVSVYLILVVNSFHTELVSNNFQSKI